MIPPEFLAAVFEAPAEDAPRLVLADWLDEHGQPERAEFIRLQCKRAAREAQLTRAGVTVTASLPGPREQQLLGQHTLTWVGGVAGACWRRGFVAELRMPCQEFLDHAAALFAAHPIEAVVLTDRHPYPYDGTFGWYSRWAPKIIHPAPYDLPPEIWGVMPKPTPSGGHRWAWYPSLEAAEKALAEGCLIYGLGLTGR